MSGGEPAWTEITGDIPFRKAYIQSIVDRVEVDDDLVRIIGDKSTLEQAIAGN